MPRVVPRVTDFASEGTRRHYDVVLALGTMTRLDTATGLQLDYLNKTIMTLKSELERYRNGTARSEAAGNTKKSVLVYVQNNGGV